MTEVIRSGRFREQMLVCIPLGRVATLGKVAPLVLPLLSDGAGYIKGENMMGSRPGMVEAEGRVERGWEEVV